MPTKDDYRRALDAAVREYETLAARRAQIDERLAQLTQTIGSLTRLCNLTPTVSVGLTDACRLVLKAAGHPLTATEVRAQLDAMGFDLTRYSNELASIHTVLKRLNQAGEVQFVPRVWDRPAYAWARPVRVVTMSRSEIDAIRTHLRRGGPLDESATKRDHAIQTKSRSEVDAMIGRKPAPAEKRATRRKGRRTDRKPNEESTP